MTLGAMIEVIHPGLQTSVQDLGRYGFQRYGVIVSGAMDSFALRMGNLLVGNEENQPVLETTLIGPRLKFHRDALIAITGEGLSPTVDGQTLQKWRQVFIRAGSTLEFKSLSGGCRVYLAVAGGISVPPIMGSASTYLRAEMGGYEGRALEKGDFLQVGTPSRKALHWQAYLERKSRNQESGVIKASAFADWFPSTDMFPLYGPNPTIRVMPGNQMNLFSEQSREQFFTQPFLVTPQSDRMGYRLKGPQLELSHHVDPISEAVTAGTVQVPTDGNPIILLADRQTTGGYPKIAQVATVDLPVMAQVRPGEWIRFQQIPVETAQRLLREQESEIQKFKQGLEVFSR